MDASNSLSWFYNDFTLFQHYQFLFLMYTDKDSNLISKADMLIWKDK